MALAKIELTPLDKRGNRQSLRKFKVLFNPESYSISKSVSWGGASSKTNPSSGDRESTSRKFNAPMLDFEGGGSRSLTLNLFYDVTEPINGRRIRDVRKLTNKMVALTRIDRSLGYPPIVRVAWGHAPTGADFPFTGVITSLTQTFTLFSSDGKPLRADLNVTFTEFLNPELDQRETDPELTSRRVKRGDSLSSLAAEVYQDPGAWRIIAQANHIDDPRRVDTGRLLSVPDLLSGES